jgi:hypothetical protein
MINKRDKEKFDNYIKSQSEIYKKRLDEEKKAIINENRELKFSLLRMLYQIEMFEEEEIRRNKEIQVKIIKY